MVLTVTKGEETVVIAVVTLAKIDGSRARLRIMADAEIGIRRYQGPLSGEDATT